MASGTGTPKKIPLGELNLYCLLYMFTNTYCAKNPVFIAFVYKLLNKYGSFNVRIFEILIFGAFVYKLKMHTVLVCEWKWN